MEGQSREDISFEPPLDCGPNLRQFASGRPVRPRPGRSVSNRSRFRYIGQASIGNAATTLGLESPCVPFEFGEEPIAAPLPGGGTPHQ